MIRTKLSKEDFQRILANYNIGNYISHKHIPEALETTCYKLRTSKGKFILKIFEGGTKTKSIKFQLKVMALLTKKKFDTPAIIKTRTGNSHIIFRNKYAFIQAYFDGKHFDRLRNNEVYRLGKDIAKLHNLLSSMKVKGYSKHICIKKKICTKRMKKFKLKQDYLKLDNMLGQLDFNKLKRGIIHSDLNPSNLLRSKNRKIVFIDWADMHDDLYAYELAIVVAQLLTKSNVIYKNQVRLLIKGYEILRKLNSEEKKAIYVAAYWRLLDAIDWVVEQMERHPDMKKEIAKWLVDIRKKYKLFGKWTIEDFLENLE